MQRQAPTTKNSELRRPAFGGSAGLVVDLIWKICRELSRRPVTACVLWADVAYLGTAESQTEPARGYWSLIDFTALDPGLFLTRGTSAWQIFTSVQRSLHRDQS
jgi:hypothetical protein